MKRQRKRDTGGEMKIEKERRRWRQTEMEKETINIKRVILLKGN